MDISVVASAVVKIAVQLFPGRKVLLDPREQNTLSVWVLNAVLEPHSLTTLLYIASVVV